jgi:RHS repeat-associated protein
MRQGRGVGAAARAALCSGAVALLAGVLPLAAHAQPATWKYEYDAVGNLTKITDPRGQVTEYVYDALSRRTQIKQPIPFTGSTRPQIGMSYDGQDQVKSVTDPRSLVTGYTTDGIGNTTTQASPDTGTTTQTFNAAGLVATRRDARNVTATYSYDALNRLTRIVYAGTGFSSLTDTYVYDQGANGIGRLTSMTFSGGSTTWSYDGFGRLTDQVQALGTLTLKLQKTYDAAGRVATMTYPSGKVVAYGYTNGLVSSVTVDGVNVATNITHMPFGAIGGWTWGNGTTHSRSFDGFGRLTGYPLGPDLRTVTYDDAGRITGMTHFPATTNNQTYGYDNLDRLTQVALGGGSRSYTYDLTGNRTSATVNGLTDTYTTEATSNRLTGITGGSARTMTYDAMGNILTDGAFTATYDARGRLRTIRIGTAANTTYTYNGLGQRIRKSGGPAGTVNYVYDDSGQLLGEYDSSGNATREYVWLGDMPLAVLTRSETIRDNPAGTNTVYVGTWTTASTPTGFYGGNYHTHPAATASTSSVTWNLALATGTYKVYARWPQNSTHSTQAKYTVTHSAGTTDVTVNQRQDGGEWVLLGTFSMASANSRVQLVPSADGIVAADAVKAVNTSEATRIFFVHADHLNAPRVVVSSSNQIRWRWISDPWGQLPPETNPQNLGVFALNMRLPGQVYDIESNLHYNYFRDYSPETGRYVQSDPIGLRGGINTYSYVTGQPTRYIDPDGRIVMALPWAVPPIVEGLVFVGTAAGAAWGLHKATQNNDASGQRQAEYERAKNFCDRGPMQTGDYCGDLSRAIDHAEQCIALYEAWDAKWSPGRHSEKMQTWKNRIANLKREHRERCTNKCP